MGMLKEPPRWSNLTAGVLEISNVIGSLSLSPWHSEDS